MRAERAAKLPLLRVNVGSARDDLKGSPNLLLSLAVVPSIRLLDDREGGKEEKLCPIKISKFRISTSGLTQMVAMVYMVLSLTWWNSISKFRSFLSCRHVRSDRTSLKTF